MTAETLRRAAALMRERAEAATPGPWDDTAPSDWASGEESWVWSESGTNVCITHEGDDPDATHIASWHPAVALEVASLLMTLADFMDEGEPLPDDLVDAHGAGIARAYLGEA